MRLVTGWVGSRCSTRDSVLEYSTCTHVVYLLYSTLCTMRAYLLRENPPLVSLHTTHCHCHTVNSHTVCDGHNPIHNPQSTVHKPPTRDPEPESKPKPEPESAALETRRGPVSRDEAAGRQVGGRASNYIERVCM